MHPGHLAAQAAVFPATTSPSVREGDHIISPGESQREGHGEKDSGPACNEGLQNVKFVDRIYFLLSFFLHPELHAGSSSRSSSGRQWKRRKLRTSIRERKEGDDEWLSKRTTDGQSCLSKETHSDFDDWT